MATHELDHKTLEIIRQLAEEHHCTIHELMSAAVQQIPDRPTNGDALLGLMADEPDLMDQVIESAYLARQQHPLRRGDS